MAEWALIEGDTIVGVGEGAAPHADVVVDARGAAVLPGFCDAHVHLQATGLYAGGLDLRGQSSADRILDALARRAASDDSILFGGNFEDADRPLTRHELDRAVGHRPAMLARADMHSCVVSSALLEQLDLTDVPGVDVDDRGEPTGYLREQAGAAAWSSFGASIDPAQQRAQILAAADAAYAKGVTTVHEMFVVEWRGWDALEVTLDVIRDVPLGVEIYPATSDVARLAEMGFSRAGGDFFLDGSFGSFTAWMRAPYSTTPPSGSSPTGLAYRDDDELVGFFVEAQRRGMQTGVHAIGDAAIEQALRVWERIAREVGVERVRSLGHRIEHFECSSDDHFRRAHALGIRASVQPAFDRYWGGEQGLYAQRIGWERAQEMNRFRSMLSAGLMVGAGSDSTVTPLDPFLQMAALRGHQVADESVDGLTALRLHTIDAHSLAGQTKKGTIAVGRSADFVVLDRDPVETPVDELANVKVLETWIGGRKVWPAQTP